MRLPDKWRRRRLALQRRWRNFKREASLYFHYVQDDIYEIDKVAHPYLRAFTGFLCLLVGISILIPIGFELTPRLIG